MRQSSARIGFLAIFCVATLVPTVAAGAPVISDPYHFVARQSANSIGLAAGDFQVVGANVNPNTGTTVTASQGGIQNAQLFFSGTVLFPDNFGRFFDLSAPNGAWTIRATTNSTGDFSTALTPNILGATLVPFVSTVTISGSGATPTFSWTLPAGYTPDMFVVQIRDTTSYLTGSGQANIVLRTVLPTSTTSFTVAPNDPGLLTPLVNGRTYSFEVQLVETQTNAFDPTGNLTNFLSRSASYFDFSLLPPGAPPNVVLPRFVNNAFNFSTPVQQGQTIYIDPLIAIGYDYAIGDPADPRFASVILPAGVGDGLYDLWLWSGTDWVDTLVDLIGGIEYAFASGGVDRFRILGIEVSAGLNPTNPVAFITGLTFTADGQFSGTMTPITVAVPEPSIVALLFVSLGILGWTATSRRRKPKTLSRSGS